MDIPSIVAAGTPVLCIDTCSILDIMRDPTRETVRPHDRKAAIELVTIAEGGGLTCLMAEQVAVEFAEHDQKIQDEAERNLRKACELIDRINQLSTVYDAPGIINLTHLDDHVARARAVVGRWLVQLDTIAPQPGVHAKAFARMNAGIAPAIKGKDSSKDCLIYETYLEACTGLRAGGLTAPIVFLSSNTREYLTESSVLKPAIASDFSDIKVAYAPNMGAARHSLGL